MSAIFTLVVTSGPRLGDLESGIAASLTTAGVAVVSGGFACVVGVGFIVLLFPALAAYDGQATTWRLTRTAMMRSSPARGAPRPSRLEVATHSVPSGAATTVLMRP